MNLQRIPSNSEAGRTPTHGFSPGDSGRESTILKRISQKKRMTEPSPLAVFLKEMQSFQVGRKVESSLKEKFHSSLSSSGYVVVERQECLL